KSLAAVLVADDDATLFENVEHRLTLIDAGDDRGAAFFHLGRVVVAAVEPDELAIERRLGSFRCVKSGLRASSAGFQGLSRDLQAKRLPAPAHQFVVRDVVAEKQQDRAECAVESANRALAPARTHDAV